MIPGPPDEALKRQIRVRLSKHELFAATGISSIRRGTGRPCLRSGAPGLLRDLARGVCGYEATAT